MLASLLALPFALATEHVGYFLRSMDTNMSGSVKPVSVSSTDLSFLKDVTHYRLLPGEFPSGMLYHFDGLATVMKFTFDDSGTLHYLARGFESPAYVNYKSCLFFGTGTGPTVGTHVCFQNPGVNLLPIGGQLWLTIDTAFWGRVDPVSLDTLPSKVRACGCRRGGSGGGGGGSIMHQAS